MSQKSRNILKYGILSAAFFGAATFALTSSRVEKQELTSESSGIHLKVHNYYHDFLRTAFGEDYESKQIVVNPPSIYKQRVGASRLISVVDILSECKKRFPNSTTCIIPPFSAAEISADSSAIQSLGNKTEIVRLFKGPDWGCMNDEMLCNHQDKTRPNFW